MIYESVIKFALPSTPAEKARAISEGLQYAAVLLIDECGYTYTDVVAALDDAESAASDEWYRLHPDE
jgi:hypothetical protein